MPLDPSMMLGNSKKDKQQEPMVVVSGLASPNNIPQMFTIPTMQPGSPMCMGIGSGMGMCNGGGMGMGWIPMGNFSLSPVKPGKEVPLLQQIKAVPEIPVWMYIIVGAVVAVIVPCFGIPAFYFGLKTRRLVKKKKYRKARKSSTRSVMFSIVGMCVLVTLIAVSFSVGITVHYVKQEFCNGRTALPTTLKPTLDPVAQRIVGSVTNKARETIHLEAGNQFYDKEWTNNQLKETDFQLNDEAEIQVSGYVMRKSVPMT